MRWRCKEMMKGMEHHHMMAPHALKLLFPLFMLIYMIVAIILTVRITNALEAMATIKALDDMEDKFSDEEKAELEEQVRSSLLD